MSEIQSLSFGIVGLGRIGTRIAHLLHAFGQTNISYWSRNKKQGVDSSGIATYRNIDELVEGSDFIIISIASGPETDALLSSDLISRMKPSANLICISKSHVLDFEALCSALSSQRLRSAFLDWFDKAYHTKAAADSGLDIERLIKSAGRSLYVSDHIANNTHDAWRRMAIAASSSLLSTLKNGTDPNLVDLTD